MKDESDPDIELPPDRGSAALLEYFWASTCDYRLFHFVIDTVLRGDLVEHIARAALDGESENGALQPEDLARANPGPRTQHLRASRQELLEMFISRTIDNFQVYVVEIVRAVLQKQPRILTERRQEVTLGYILQFESIDGLIRDILEGKIHSLSYEGFGDLEKWCSAKGIPLIVPDDRREEITKFIATRNLIIHNRGVVDSRYLKVVPSIGYSLGEKHLLEVDDIFRAVSLLNGIVISSDAAITGKFELDRVKVRDEIKQRSNARWGHVLVGQEIDASALKRPGTQTEGVDSNNLTSDTGHAPSPNSLLKE